MPLSAGQSHRPSNRTMADERMEVESMTDKEQAIFLIDVYTDVMRVKKAQEPNRDKELDMLLRKTKVKLETLGVVGDDLIGT